MTTATPTHRSRRSRPARPTRRRTTAGVVASGLVAVLAASLGVTAGGAGAASAAGAAAASPGVQRQGAVTCRPWQTAVTVPAGTVLTPRVFPSDERPPAPHPTTKPDAEPGAK